jgi:superfamily I DNA/RNA helicase
MDVKPTGEQLAIIDAVRSRKDLVVSATTISTAHKAKGREWDSVQIAGDFPEPSGRDDIPRADAMLAYVAVTRARKHLDPAGLAWIDRFIARRRTRAAG